MSPLLQGLPVGKIGHLAQYHQLASQRVGRMAQLKGVDGCKGGWIIISRDLESGAVTTELVPSGCDLIYRALEDDVIALDIPIGLMDSGPRQCDLLARRLLGIPRGSSVFPAPIRPALAASSRKEADGISRSIDGRGVGAQAFGICSRVREIDELMLSSDTARKCIHEVHPEVSFAAWNHGSPIVRSKKSPEGTSLRLTLVQSHFGEDAVNHVLDAHRSALVGDDDIYDAFAALWTAERIYRGIARVIPDPPDIDSSGLPMGIWY
jgi:predicted RNase H-like nuclease